MSRPMLENLHVQLVPLDHESLFGTVLYAYDKVARSGAHASLLHRAVLSLEYKPDPDEINRLRALQRQVREQEASDADEVVAELEARILGEYARDRRPSAMASWEAVQIRDAGVRWAVAGKRGPVIRISPELLGLLDHLYGRDSQAYVEGTTSPAGPLDEPVFPPDPHGVEHNYRAPADVLDAYKALSFVDRPTLDAALDAVIGDGPEAEETATWLEADFEALTRRYEIAAAGKFGLWLRYS